MVFVTPDDGQRNCPKHVEFYSKNKIEKLVHLVGFIIRIYQDERSAERQIRFFFSERFPKRSLYEIQVNWLPTYVQHIIYVW